MTVVVEIPGGSRNKYEMDHDSGLVYLDRMLFTATRYPADYGFIEGTMGEDGDPLDALVFVGEPTFPGCRIVARPIGNFGMRDEKGQDDKILCVPLHDPAWSHIEKLDDLLPTLRNEIEHFFEVYKDLEAKKVETQGFGDVVVSGCTGSSRPPQRRRSRQPRPSMPATVEPVAEVLTGGRYDFRPLPDVPSFSVAGDRTGRLVRLSQLGHGRALPVRADAPTRIDHLVLHGERPVQRPVPLGRVGTGGADVGDVEVGPTVDDLGAALRANTFYTSSAATPVTIDGYAGQELELQLPDDPFTTCDEEPGDADGHAFVFSGAGLYAQGPANQWHLYILDVEGTRLIAVILSYAKTPQADLDLARNVIETLDIDPRSIEPSSDRA